MILKEVGAMPKVSNKAVSFDYSKPDKYIYLNATVDLLQALDYSPSQRKDHLYNTIEGIYTSNELLDYLTKHCSNLNNNLNSSVEKSEQLIEDLKTRVNENTIISEDGRSAWLNNIKTMTNYYLQYIVNENAYKSALEALADKIKNTKIEEISFPMFRHYGFVLNDLITNLENLKPPVDASLSVESKDNIIIGTLNIKHQVKLSI